MDEDKIPTEREIASLLAQWQAQQDERMLLLASVFKRFKIGAEKVWKQLKGSAEMLAFGSTSAVSLEAALSSSPELLLIAAQMGFGVYLWQRENQNNSLRKLEQKIKKIQDKLNQPALNFDEFMELFLQFMESASRSPSDEKQNYLVNLFINSVVSSTIPFSGKQTLFRIYLQISIEEIHGLKVINDAGIEAQNQGEFPSVPVTEVAKKLGWQEGEAFVICEALAQLLLISDAMIGTWGYSTYQQHEVWRITALGARFIRWVTEEVPPATPAKANTSEPMDSAEKAAWSQLTAEQFFSGYSEAEGIYDTI
jgi:hypothetical protein